MRYEYSTERLGHAIQTMRDACDQAERIMKYEDHPTITAALNVQHALTWGFANASSSVESAISNAHRQWEKERAMMESSKFTPDDSVTPGKSRQ